MLSPNRSYNFDSTVQSAIALTTMHTEYDVVIIGGGLSGLVTAYKIKKKAPSLSFRILEATNRFGGQIRLCQQGVDMGARWVNSEQWHILKLCNELNIEVATRTEYGPGARRQWDIDRSVFAGIAKFELDRFLRYVDVMCEEYYPGRHRYTRNLCSGDTMESFLCGNLMMPSSRNVVRLLVRAACGCEANRISLSEYMMVCNGTNGITPQLDSLMGTNNQQEIMPNFNQLINALIEFVGRETILTETRLEEVRQTQSGINLVCENSQVVRSDVIVLAIPLQNVQQVRFFPDLPVGLVSPKIESRFVTSFVCKFNREFWKTDVPTATFMFHSPHMVAYPFDRDRSLAGLIFHDPSWEEHSVQQHVLNKLVPEDQIADIHSVQWNERTWQQSAIRGIPTTSTWKRIVWAGTNSGQLYRGFSNGAVQGGMRAAYLVLTMLRPAVVGWEDLAEIQKANVVHRRSMGVWDRWLLSWNVYNSVQYFVVLPGCVWMFYCAYRRWDSF